MEIHPVRLTPPSRVRQVISRVWTAATTTSTLRGLPYFA